MKAHGYPWEAAQEPYSSLRCSTLRMLRLIGERGFGLEPHHERFGNYELISDKGGEPDIVDSVDPRLTAASRLCRGQTRSARRPSGSLFRRWIQPLLVSSSNIKRPQSNARTHSWTPGSNLRHTAPRGATRPVKFLNHFKRRRGFDSPRLHSSFP